jgi:hypothetical protein
MNVEVRTYLESVVASFDARLRSRKAQKGWFNTGSLKDWEKKLYDGAKKLLAQEDTSCR